MLRVEGLSLRPRQPKPRQAQAQVPGNRGQGGSLGNRGGAWGTGVEPREQGGEPREQRSGGEPRSWVFARNTRASGAG
eukprot:110808-Chlamydomonas_euryale.AAC.1